MHFHKGFDSSKSDKRLDRPLAKPARTSPMSFFVVRPKVQLEGEGDRKSGAGKISDQQKSWFL